MTKIGRTGQKVGAVKLQGHFSSRSWKLLYNALRILGSIAESSQPLVRGISETYEKRKVIFNNFAAEL